MSVAIPSDEVAEDYKNSLEDLTLNSRYEISNLTVIAKENTEHALTISRVLENHIRNTPPDRKLPALYVLDSVVKNVGTPYTLFLGRNLYSIFMNAYSLVNLNVRKKLDEMLSTWEGPVPGSLDSRPVFPPDTTRQIRTALIKARTAAIQEQQQQQLRTQREMMARQRPVAIPNTQWVSTPTPPQANGRYYPPPQQGLSQPNVPNGYYQVCESLAYFEFMLIFIKSNALHILIQYNIRLHNRSRNHIILISNRPHILNICQLPHKLIPCIEISLSLSGKRKRNSPQTSSINRSKIACRLC